MDDNRDGQGRFGDAMDQAKDAAGRAGAAVQEAADKVGSQASDLGSTVYEQGARAGRYVGQTVQGRPLEAMLMVGGVCFALGFLLGRQSS
jgi:ElaB/YqjD/DUF883 family membrane-anchored ribosome-binding protein